ncbi:hypothetical protein [Segatella copri]|uniref:hypothetical protein n=1 Tax=Segatella copri TaxID=165179 RepID=UPI002232A70E|nr:hypothetical protein [Segatella copri]MCW4078720.1 hypothetical protein [Segatella copri]
MGALEFLPEVAKTDKAEMIDVKSLADLLSAFSSSVKNAHIMPEESITHAVLAYGGNIGWWTPT